MSEQREKRWFPLESNPVTMTDYVKRLGFPVNQYCFHDVLSTEDWALGMVPGPVIAVLMLFPIKEASEKHKAEENALIQANGQTVSPDVFYMKQLVGNACGTIGLLHAVANVRNMVSYAEGSFLEKFVSANVGRTPLEIGEALGENDEIQETHGAAAQEGESKLEALDTPIDTHFIALSHVDGHLYELDGRKEFPINHGATTPETMLADSVAVVKKFMARDEGEVRFTIVALGKAGEA